MHLQLPQNLKHRKYCRRFLYPRGAKQQRSASLFLGSSCGLVACESGSLTRDQLAACLKVLTIALRKKRSRRKQKSRVFSCSAVLRGPVTAKSLGSRMGRGKGNVAGWVCYVKRGRVLFQVQNACRIQTAVRALSSVAYKLPILTRLVLRYPFTRARLVKRTQRL